MNIKLQLNEYQTLIIVMSERKDESEDMEGFRSRDEDTKRRQQIRRQIMQKHEAEYHNDLGNKVHTNIDRSQADIIPYIGLSQTLAKKEKDPSEEDFDMFSDHDSNQNGNQLSTKQDQGKNQNQSKNQPEHANITKTDESGYYHIITNKLLQGGKYQIVEKIGKGMFGIVAKAIQINKTTHNEEIALKIMRKNQMTTMSGERQYKILSGIKRNQHIIRMIDYFHEDNHLFLVCELMGMDLRSYTHKNQNKITLDCIKQYAISMFMALHELRKEKIIHADIKPDNFLFTVDAMKIKLTDFGTAFSVQDYSCDVDELVARYYRAPEIILGLQMVEEQRYAIDTWAVGCSLYELFTGQFLFDGDSNNQMLMQIMQTRGRFNLKMLKKSKFAEKHFDQEFNFLYNSYDKNTKEYVLKRMQACITPERQLLNLLKKYAQFAEDAKLLFNFKQFLDKCLMLNPRDRLSPEQAFRHPFLNYQVKLS